MLTMLLSLDDLKALMLEKFLRPGMRDKSECEGDYALTIRSRLSASICHALSPCRRLALALLRVLPLDLGEIGDFERERANLREQREPVLADLRGVRIDGHLVEEGIDRRPEF